MKRLGTLGCLAALGLVLCAVGDGVAAEPSEEEIRSKLLGASCSRAFTLVYDSEEDVLKEFHPLDSRWVELDVRHVDLDASTRHYDVRWAARAGVVLCPSWARVGWGVDARRPLDAAGGRLSFDLRPTAPVDVKVRARFADEISLRPGLTRSRVASLVAGWARRACDLDESDPGAAQLLSDLAGRAGARGCRRPRRVRPSAATLLRHLSAYFNAQSGQIVGAADAAWSHSLATEYYRVLGQLTRREPRS